MIQTSVLASCTEKRPRCSRLNTSSIHPGLPSKPAVLSSMGLPSSGAPALRPPRGGSLRHQPEERVTPPRLAEEGALPSPRVAGGSPRPQVWASEACNSPARESSSHGGCAGLAMTLTGCRFRPGGGTSGSSLAPAGRLPACWTREAVVRSGRGPLGPGSGFGLTYPRGIWMRFSPSFSPRRRTAPLWRL